MIYPKVKIYWNTFDPKTGEPQISIRPRSDVFNMLKNEKCKQLLL